MTLNLKQWRPMVRAALLPALGPGWTMLPSGYEVARAGDDWMLQSTSFNRASGVEKATIVAFVQPLFLRRSSFILSWAKISPKTFRAEDPDFAEKVVDWFTTAGAEFWRRWGTVEGFIERLDDRHFRDEPNRWFPNNADTAAYARGLPLLGRGDELDSIWPAAVEKIRGSKVNDIEPLRETWRAGGQPAVLDYLREIRQDTIDNLGVQDLFDLDPAVPRPPG